MGIMNNIFRIEIISSVIRELFYAVWGSYGGKYKQCCLLGCDTVWTDEILLLPLSALMMETVGPSVKCYTGYHLVKVLTEFCTE